ncbi:hypothetical protein GCM10023205_18640 [Yinghuangia aomiensis]|uniref:Uncharacterized protein n=1 Tax=Yinghuangia aomiensis TaxID=676205 RepID=A0ABP9GXZ4_9ACTN
MPDEGSPRSPLRYGEEITLGDVDAIVSFVSERIAQSARAPRGSDERQMARSIQFALKQLAGSLRHALPLVAAATPAEADDYTPLRTQIRSNWNTLRWLSAPWQIHDAYDHARWQDVKYWDVRHAAETESLLRAAIDRRDLGHRP